MRTAVMALTLCSVVLHAPPAAAQEPRYLGPNPPGEGEERVGAAFFPIGWSEDGTVLAFGWFEVTRMISNGSQISIVVQSIITDEVLGRHGGTWEEGNYGPGRDNPYPETAAAAWALVKTEGEALLRRFDIWGGTETGLLELPMLGERHLEIEVREAQGEPGYTVHAVLREADAPEPLQKMIASGDEYADQVRVVGYLPNPDWSRIAVVLNVFTGELPYSQYRVVGCHLTAGFGR